MKRTYQPTANKDNPRLEMPRLEHEGTAAPSVRLSLPATSKSFAELFATRLATSPLP